MKKKIPIFAILSLVLFGFAAAQSGGVYTITQSVISPGGTEQSAGNFELKAVIAQPLAGTQSVGGAGNQYALISGFLVPETLAPTSSKLGIKGRIFMQRGIPFNRTAEIILTDAVTGVTRTTQTDRAGFYKFDNLDAGHFFIIRAESGNIQFTPANYALNLFEDTENMDFTAEKVYEQPQ